MNDSSFQTRYGYGRPNPSYEQVLSTLEHSKVNSWRTSSLPLADFWRPERIPLVQALFAERFPGVDLVSGIKCFEYPVSFRDLGVDGVRGKASMTDLMILDGAWRIAIEAKYTEYQSDYETIGHWKRFDSKNREIAQENGFDTSRNRHNVLEAWLSGLADAGCLREDVPSGSGEWLDEVPYQFLHRAASAACGITPSNPPRPALVYQLFFDNDNRHEMFSFAKSLSDWHSALHLGTLPFFVFGVRITNAAEVKCEFENRKDAMFTAMKKRSLFEFDEQGMFLEHPEDVK